MIKIKTFSTKGVKGEEFSLPKEFSAEVNMRTLAQALRVYEMRSHTGFSKVKTRAEVNRTGKKLYRQKGTGGARHGSKRAPIFVGGGVAHGPKIEKRKIFLPGKVAIIARNMAFSLKVKKGEVVGVSGLSKVEKVKDFSGLLKSLEGKKFLLAVSEKNLAAAGKLVNIKNLKVTAFRNLNALEILRSGVLVLDKDIFDKTKKEK